MENNAKKLEEYSENHNAIDTTMYFINKVKPGGEWDFKSQENWNLREDDTYRYANKILRFDDIGNIHYGFVGSVLYPETVLLMAGGIVQIYTKTSSLEYYDSWFDDPRDQNMISFGCILWDLNKGGKK